MTLEMSTFVSICLLVPVIKNSVGGISMWLVTQLSAGVKKELVVCFRHQNVCYTTFQVCRAHPWRLQDDGTFHDMLTHHPKPVNSYFNDEHCILITMPFGTCVVFLSMNSCQDLYVNIESSARMMHIFL
ncbi:hypothetical protein BDL97_05G035000 [Sphagnum fallax]|nr:hypothetical protein BDL97_05G035000 [Sphagnum fallax]KAH8961141.1 hypothetical protein BDL97_05G035000 [Sphagnum fallax]